MTVTTKDVLNTLMFQGGGHGCLGGEDSTLPNCQIVKNHEEVQNLKLSENSFHSIEVCL